MTTTAETADRPAEQIAASLADLDFAEIPSAVVSLVERAFVDTIGVTLAGTTVGAGRIAVGVVEHGGDGPAPVIGTAARAARPEAGFATGVAAHTLDYDDVSDAIIGHPSACLVPAILAVADAGDLSGEAVITAYVAGFETEAAIAASINPGHYERGWHATATYGTFGAAAAAATALGLDQPAFVEALNLAASLPAGLKRNFGSMAKPMHAGAAVRSGVTAALLAAEGFDAAADAIDGGGGFLDLYSGEGDPGDIRSPGTGEIIREAGLDVKKYPCCYYTHTAIEVATELAADHDLDPTAVEAVEVTASGGAGDALIYPAPADGFEGRFSMEYTVANAIVHGDVGPAAFEAERLADPVVEAVRDRVTFTVDADRPYPSYESSVTIRTAGGETVEGSAPSPPGYHDNPLTEAELREKYTACAAGVLDDASIETTYTRLRSLAEEPALLDLLAEF